MNSIIHYTSEKNWKSIIQSDLLFPKTNPYSTKYSLSDKVKKIIKSDKYVVGIKNNADFGWINAGIYGFLFEKTTGEVALEVPITQKYGAFVRDHLYISPKGFMEFVGVDLFTKMVKNKIEEEDDRIDFMFEKYFNSTISLGDYKDNYECPEIWIPQKTPVYKITKLI
jgi:hypothetical protein